MDDQPPKRNSPPSKASTPEPPLPSPSVNERLIAERVTTLLSHYWTAADAPEVRKLQMGDWLDDLCEFPAAHVAEACAEWRRKPGGKRPTPGDIRTLCVEMRQLRPPPRPLLPVPSSPHPFPSRDDFYWLKEREGELHSEQDDARIRAYQIAWKRLNGDTDASDPDLWQMIAAAEKLMRQVRAAA